MKNDTFIQNKQNDSVAPVIIPPPTIPLNEAIARAASWRNMLTGTPSSKSTADDSNIQPGVVAIPQQLVFRAINIRIDDLQWLMAQHPDASSVRVYMSLPDADKPYQICGMLVPVDAQNRDMLTLASDESVSRDDMMNSEATSTVYDFTQPCPTTCNTQSPLYNSGNSPDAYFRYKK